MSTKHTMSDLYQMQSLPLSIKIKMTKERIRQWVDYYGEEGVYVSFSGGKDSTVLLDIARSIYPNIKAAFIDTGLEYPEIREFVKSFENVDWIKPEINFKKVIKEYGYPFISKEVSGVIDGARRYIKILTDRQTDTGTFRIPETTEEYAELANMLNKDWGKTQGSPARLAILMGMLSKANQAVAPSSVDRSKYAMTKYKFLLTAPFELSNKCCRVMKKNPAHRYSKQTGRNPIIATMATESRLRTQKWLQEGCNTYNSSNPASKPMSFWTEQDVLLYIKNNNIPIAKVYGDVVKDYEASGQLEGQMDISELSEEFGIFDIKRPLLKTTGAQRTGCMFCGFGCHLEKSPNRFEKMKEKHPKQYDYIMRPEEEGGLNYKNIIDWINENGNMNIKY